MKVIKNTEFGCAEVVDDAFERVRVSAGRTHIVIWKRQNNFSRLSVIQTTKKPPPQKKIWKYAR